MMGEVASDWSALETGECWRLRQGVSGQQSLDIINSLVRHEARTTMVSSMLMMGDSRVMGHAQDWARSRLEQGVSSPGSRVAMLSKLSIDKTSEQRCRERRSAGGR